MTSNASLFDLQITKLMLALRKLTRFTNLKGGGMFRSKKKKKIVYSPQLALGKTG